MSENSIDEYRGLLKEIVRSLALSSAGLDNNPFIHSNPNSIHNPFILQPKKPDTFTNQVSPGKETSIHYPHDRVNDFQAHHRYNQARNLSLIQNASNQKNSNEDTRVSDSESLFSLGKAMTDTCPAPQQERDLVSSNSQEEMRKDDKRISNFWMHEDAVDPDDPNRKEWEAVLKNGSYDEVNEAYMKDVEKSSTSKPVTIFNIEVNDKNRALLTTLKKEYPSGYAPLPGREDFFLYSILGLNKIRITEDNYNKWQPIQNEFEEKARNTIDTFVDIITSDNPVQNKELDDRIEEQKLKKNNPESGLNLKSVGTIGTTGYLGLAALGYLYATPPSGMIPAPPSKKK